MDTPQGSTPDPLAHGAITTWTFALVVVRGDEHFLLVREDSARGPLWTLPAGHVEPGESLLDAARRETLEETGVEIEIDGILRVEHTSARNGGQRLRVLFTARPLGDGALHARAPGVRWVSLDELDGLELHGEEMRDIFEVVARGMRAPYALDLLAHEGAPWSRAV